MIVISMHFFTYWFLLKICIVFGNSFADRFSLRITLFLVLVGLSGLFVEIINAFEYAQSARSVFRVQD